MCVFFFSQAALQDSQVELETYKQTRQGLDEMYNEVWKQYKEEKHIRQVGYHLGIILLSGVFKVQTDKFDFRHLFLFNTKSCLACVLSVIICELNVCRINFIPACCLQSLDEPVGCVFFSEQHFDINLVIFNDSRTWNVSWSSR